MAMAISIPYYTVDDLEQFPQDGTRYELLDGVLLVTPQPNASHQIVVSRLMGRLIQALQWPGHAHVVGPGVVQRGRKTQLQPDILVYPARYAPKLHWKKVREHWLAVEVLSRSSHVYDRKFKLKAYFALGVDEVWLVDRRRRTVEIWRTPNVSEIAIDRLEWHVPAVDVTVTIDLHEVFADIDSL